MKKVMGILKILYHNDTKKHIEALPVLAGVLPVPEFLTQREVQKYLDYSNRKLTSVINFYPNGNVGGMIPLRDTF